MALFSGSILLAACGGDGGTGGAPQRRDRRRWRADRPRGPAQPLPLGRVRRPEAVQAVHRRFGPATQIDIYASNEETIPKLARRRAPAATTSSCRPASTSRRWSSQGLLARARPRARSRTSPTSRSSTRTSRGTRTTRTRCARTGVHRLDLRQRADLDAASTTWTDFIDVAQDAASGNTSVLDTPTEPLRHLLLGQRHRLDDRRTPPTCDACEEFLVNEFAPHIKAFDSYPGIASPRATTRSPRSGTATRVRASSRQDEDPERYTWGARRTRDRAVDGQLVHPRRARERRRRVRLHQLHPRPGELRCRTSSSTGTTPASRACRRRRCRPTRRTSTWSSSTRTRWPRWRRRRERGARAAGPDLQQGEGGSVAVDGPGTMAQRVADVATRWPRSVAGPSVPSSRSRRGSCSSCSSRCRCC